MPRLGALAIVISLLAGSGPAVAAPARIVSLNLCADLLALLFAAPGQIAAITRLAADEELSPLAERARSVRAIDGRAEDVITLQPDLVLVGAFTARPTVRLLQRLGVPMTEVPIVTGIDAAKAEMVRIASLLGNREAGLREAAIMDARLAGLLRPREPRPRAIVYQANGIVAGTSSLAHDVLVRAGIINVAASLGLPQGNFLPIENMLLARPDLLVLESYRPDLPSLAQNMLSHPAIRASLAERRVAAIPSRLWTCPGPWLADATEELARLGGDL